MTPCDAAPLLPLAVVVEAAADELDELEPKGEVAVAEPAAEPVVDGVPDEPEPEAVEVAERVTPCVEEREIVSRIRSRLREGRVDNDRGWEGRA